MMHQYTTAPPADPLKQAQSDLNNVYVMLESGSRHGSKLIISKDIMVQNIDSILQRGERLDLLVDKTDTLAGQAYAFRRGARNVRRQQWWKNVRIMMLTGVVGVVSLLFLVVRPCEVEELMTDHTLRLHCSVLWTIINPLPILDSLDILVYSCTIISVDMYNAFLVVILLLPSTHAQ